MISPVPGRQQDFTETDESTAGSLEFAGEDSLYGPLSINDTIDDHFFIRYFIMPGSPGNKKT